MLFQSNCYEVEQALEPIFQKRRVHLAKKDFLSKMYIAFKECAETSYWLELLHETDYLNESQFQSIYNDCLSLKSLLSSITKTTAEAINS